ncbi:MAG: leucine-rich repeat domain-containing protein [Clostridium sp.]|uniref:leucine-rich repeat domain-containing protein n=1 Tax=Clostridium sp. TaxID=1506 RepID=UPI002A753B67|nr:leucine-rich repeat domain-containing protein [Clostridium sp.]MDY2629941.1 leucine-rich repeat domain-containing protein [Clostridium sp.]
MSTTIDGFDYTIVGGEAWVVGYVGVEVNITIPSTIEGYQVGRIGYAAFENNYNIVSVLIPSNVNYIGNYAFSNCSNLVDINVNYGNPNYSSSFGVLYNKLQTNLICAPAGLTGALGIPPTVTTISDWAFAYSHLTSINMPNSVTNIGIYAFRNCRNLNNINIPGSVINIGDKAFSYCENLTWITVDSNNLNYSSLDGVLYNKSQSILICYPAGRIGAFIVPNSVTSINFSAFENCTKLTSITMGSSLNTIGDSAFEYCTNLESVIIGSGINNIADGGFYSCSKLKYIKFLGNAPSMGIQVFDNASSDFKVYYTYGKTGFTNPWYGYQTEALYIVIYNGNGNTSGTVPVDSNTYQLNQSVVVSDNTGLLQNSGHNFNGWNTQADGNGTHYEPGDSFFIGNNNIILYAQWTAYKVSYNGNGNTSGTVPIDSKEYKSGDTVKVLDNIGLLNKTGYSFGG